MIQAILGSASLFGMTSDLSLSVVNHSTSPPSTDTTRLSWATSIFYFGMLAGLYPMTFILQRFTLHYVFGPIVMAWAITCAATAGVTTWQGLFVQRFFLGSYQHSYYLPIYTLSNSNRVHRKRYPHWLYDHR